MQVIIDKNISTYSQIKGFGEGTSTFNLIVNVAKMLDRKDARQFILALQITANNNTYSYSNIYTVESIQPNGDIVVGEITIVGLVNLDLLSISAKVIYLEQSTY